MSPTDPTQPPAETFARDLDRVTRRVDDLTHTVTGVEEQLGGMDESISNLGETLARLLEVTTLRPQSWLLLDDTDVAVKVLTDLVAWLDAVYLRYPGVKLPTCWGFHPWVIEELWWLRCAHAESYAGRGWGHRAGMWHDQQRPRVVERIQKHLGACDLQKHQVGGTAAGSLMAAPLAGHVQAIAEAWPSTGLPPEPTAEQLEDARQYDAAKLRLS